MTLYFEVYDGTNWVDKTGKCTYLKRRISARNLESLEAELLETVNVGTRVRLRKNTSTIFEGVVYESRKTHREGDVARCEITAYTDLILYDRHVVFRSYATGTKAGTIIKDLAALETGVDVTNVDEDTTPALNSQWDIQNEVALEIMQSVARGTNYWLRMKPGKTLYFKPKTIGTAAATIDGTKTISSEYSEDRWRLKNRVIYVGADGQVLADVSEGAGDLPVVVHDPFLTDAAEAQRRAQIRLALNKEYGKQLSVEMHQDDFEALRIDLGDTVTVNLPSLGLSNVNMFLLEIEYEPRELKYSLTLGGKLEMFEEFFEERVGGDVAARFGQAINIPERISTLYTVTEAIGEGVRIIGMVKYPVYLNRPPLTLYNSNNIILDSNGFAQLIAGATEGSFETSVLPNSPLFTAFIKAEWMADSGQGRVSAEILDSSGNVITRVGDAVDTQYTYVPRWPWALGWITRRAASSWGGSGAAASDVWAGIINSNCLKLTPATQGVEGEIFYPAAKNLNLDIAFARYMRLYFYGDHANDFSVKIRLHTDASNYMEGVVTVKHDTWAKYELALATFMRVGNPSTLNWISILSPRNLLIDSDYVFLSFIREQTRVRFKLSRDSAAQTSPKIRWVKIIWREGDYG
ncbi:MAG: hypothetical protein QXI60_01040 [Thermofilaceae archaeon]